MGKEYHFFFLKEGPGEPAVLKNIQRSSGWVESSRVPALPGCVAPYTTPEACYCLIYLPKNIFLQAGAELGQAQLKLGFDFTLNFSIFGFSRSSNKIEKIIQWSPN